MKVKYCGIILLIFVGTVFAAYTPQHTPMDIVVLYTKLLIELGLAMIPSSVEIELYLVLAVFTIIIGVISYLIKRVDKGF
jgi:hypothetical protein